mmetsp:Transcript_20129/g.50811  ORF Transcript_20129/g.50811 Transcript_20129/m.50811 type:complete len:216 (-) Transcript_20129:1484-2131(-)
MPQAAAETTAKILPLVRVPRPVLARALPIHPQHRAGSRREVHVVEAVLVAEIACVEVDRSLQFTVLGDLQLHVEEDALEALRISVLVLVKIVIAEERQRRIGDLTAHSVVSGAGLVDFPCLLVHLVQCAVSPTETELLHQIRDVNLFIVRVRMRKYPVGVVGAVAPLQQARRIRICGSLSLMTIMPAGVDLDAAFVEGMKLRHLVSRSQRISRIT